MLTNAAECAETVREEELPVPLATRKQEPDLSGDKPRTEADGIHLTHRLVVLIMGKWCAHNEFAHVVVVVVVGEQDTLVDALLMVGSEVKWSAESDLECAGQSSVHEVLHCLHGEIELLSGLPVVAHHDCQMRMKSVLGHPCEALLHVLHLVALVQTHECLVIRGLEPEQHEPEVRLGHQLNGLFVEVFEPSVDAEVAVLLVQTTVDDALRKLPRFTSAIPHT